MYKLVKKKEWEWVRSQMQMQERALKEKEQKIEEAESLCQMLELENRQKNFQLLEVRRENRRLERRIRERLWRRVRDILIQKEKQAGFAKETCGCYYNGENGKWEVVTGVGLTDREDAERMLFSKPADARCYYEMMQAFGMAPFTEESGEPYWSSLAETA